MDDKSSGELGAPKRATRKRAGQAVPATGARGRRSNAVQVKPPPPITQRGRATRERLLAALSELLQDHAFYEIRLEDITRLAGVRVSLFYHYFQSKIDITYELLSELLEAFRGEVAGRPKDTDALDAIHYANQRMVALYAANPGAMRCLLEVSEGSTPFAPMWRELTLYWNQRIAHSIARQFPEAFKTPEEYLALAYALAGAADNFLFEYFVQKNQVLRQAQPTNDDVARFLTTLWHRTLYLRNPPEQFLERLEGFKKVGPR